LQQQYRNQAAWNFASSSAATTLPILCEWLRMKFSAGFLQWEPSEAWVVEVWRARQVQLSEVSIHETRGLFGDDALFHSLIQHCWVIPLPVGETRLSIFSAVLLGALFRAAEQRATGRH
jgi:hypothetical protein